MKNPKFDYENEIKGGYHDDEPIGWLAIIAMVFFIGLFLATLILAVLDLIFGGERVTEIIASFF